MITLRDAEAKKDMQITALVDSAEARAYGEKKDKYMLSLVVVMPGGQKIGAVHWNVEPDKANGMAGRVITAMATVGTYKESLQLTLNGIKYSKIEDVSNYAKRSVRDPLDAVGDIIGRTSHIVDGYLRGIVQKFVHDKSFEKFAQYPAGTSWHHSRVGGLAEHTLQVVTTSLQLVDEFAHLNPAPNRDLVLAGAILHDVGKLRELTPFPFQYTDEGCLLGHQLLGVQMIADRAGVPTNPTERLKYLHLLHIVAASHDTFGQSPVVAKTVEAMIVHQADLASSRTDGIIMEVQKGLEQDPGATCLGWSNKLARKPFVTPDFPADQSPKENRDVPASASTAEDDSLPY